jgi:hypothetical protein
VEALSLLVIFFVFLSRLIPPVFFPSPLLLFSSSPFLLCSSSPVCQDQGGRDACPGCVRHVSAGALQIYTCFCFYCFIQEMGIHCKCVERIRTYFCPTQGVLPLVADLDIDEVLALFGLKQFLPNPSILQKVNHQCVCSCCAWLAHTMRTNTRTSVTYTHIPSYPHSARSLHLRAGPQRVRVPHRAHLRPLQVPEQ